MSELKELKSLVDSGKDELLRFDFAVGNPPYQRALSKGSTAAAQLYPEFIQATFEIAAVASLVTPARWFNNEPQKDFRAWLKSSGVERNALSLTFYEAADSVFTNDVFIRGGISLLTLDHSHLGKTLFKFEDGSSKLMPLISESGTVDLDRTIVEVRRILQKIHSQPIPTREMTIDYHNGILRAARKAWGGSSRATFVENTVAEKSNEYDLKLRLTKNEWRYAKSSAIKVGIPRGSFGVNFKQDVIGVDDEWEKAPGLNKLHILKENEALMSSVGILLDDVRKTAAFYRYSRTPFFTAIVCARVTSHHASKRVYQDLPMFNFDQSDPIDWKTSSANIHHQLIDYFGLSEYAEWFEQFTTPYSAPLDEEYLSILPSDEQKLCLL